MLYSFWSFISSPSTCIYEAITQVVLKSCSYGELLSVFVEVFGGKKAFHLWEMLDWTMSDSVHPRSLPQHEPSLKVLPNSPIPGHSPWA